MNSEPTSDKLIQQFEQFIRIDPAGRGLLSADDGGEPLSLGELAHAARDLAERGTHVAIVTGFFIPRAEIPSAETDGPPGALMLATTFERLGRECHVITDEPCYSAVKAAAIEYGFPTERVLSVPHQTEKWTEEFFTRGPGCELTHLIAVERVGPSHTPQSLTGQQRMNAAPIEKFTNEVPLDEQDRCHNMRGEIIDHFTADVHRLFEALPRYRPAARTVGIGDGGNEIGMGKIPWERLANLLPGPTAPLIPCRIAADWNILAGTSNWGGFALSAAILLLADRRDILASWDGEQQRRVLERMVSEGPAVDGVTRLPEVTVDGLPLLTYLQPWLGIRRLLGLGE